MLSQSWHPDAFKHVHAVAVKHRVVVAAGLVP